MTPQDFRRLALAHELLPCYAPAPETKREQAESARHAALPRTGCEQGMTEMGRATVELGSAAPT
jgi:hypothetical protein